MDSFPNKNDSTSTVTFMPEQVEEYLTIEEKEPPVQESTSSIEWKRVTKKREKGKTAGRVDVYYYPKPGVRLRSLKEVKNYCDNENINFDPKEFDFSTKRELKNVTDEDLSEESSEEEHSAMVTEIPKSYREAIVSSLKEKWINAMETEISILKDREVWEIVPRPRNKTVIGCRWVYSIKENVEGQILRYKARLVAQGFHQVEVIRENWIHKHIDIECAYLYGSLNEKLYLEQPEGFQEKPKADYVALLKKSLYGLHQSGRQWFKELNETFISIGFYKYKYTNCVYIYQSPVVILVYVDDLVIFAKNEESMKEVITKIKKKFKLRDLGEVKYLLGIEFEQIDGKVYLHQRKYINKLLKKFDVNICEEVKVPLSVDMNISKSSCPTNVQEKKFVEKFPYRELIGNLMFLASRTRPDIQFAVTFLSQYRSNPGLNHWKAALQILKYVGSTSDLPLS
ncbi:Retrovirus-related Pol polyprotein from transposon TNT 1-94 [Araneus ventricosus]|uniref:Retrovirus-related Pol polyprotein from transposon TNT 1-94 n=1 Tax=Araneus ventricosus TaxID=182803 RepID=A0A4Y2RAB0_ARAVE|nr:Retrovirus-related Pol polyprotein from transposon TNT 1-94 [Araneus ventricosus]